MSFISYSASNNDSKECNDDILKGTSFFKTYSDVLNIFHVR